MTIYYADYQPNQDGFLVTFPDVPEAITGGMDRREADANAQDALEVALLTYAEAGRVLPASKSRQGVPVAISASVAVKIAFIEAFKASGLTRVALAERLGKQESEVRRMLDPYHGSKLAAMEAGLHVLGKQLVVTVRNAA